MSFDPFYHNKMAEDKLGNKIKDDQWDYSDDQMEVFLHYIADPGYSIFLFC